MGEERNYSAGFSRPILILALAVAIVLGAGTLSLYVLLVKMPSDLAHNTAAGIRDLFNFTPRVLIHETIVIEENHPIAELATVSRPIHIDSTWSQQWMGSTKTVQLQGTFIAKAGFDLAQPFRIHIQRYPLRVEARMPEPRILSLELTDFRIVRDEDGWWNRVSNQDREEAIARLQATAREKADQSGLLADARRSIEERISELVERNGSQVLFRYPPLR